MKQKMEAAAIAAFHSLWITGCAVACALVIGAHKIGATDTPAHFILYVKANYLDCILTILFAPSIRATIAARTTKGQTNP